MPPPDGNAPAEGSQQQASGPQTPPQHSQSKSYMRDAAVPIPEEGPLLQENLSAPAGLPQPVAPRSPLSQPQVPESPVSVGLVQPQHPAAPLGEPLHPHEDADEKDLANGSCSYTGGVGERAPEERPLLPVRQSAPARFPALDVPGLGHKRSQLSDVSLSEFSQPVRVVLCEEPDPTAPPEEQPLPLKDLTVNYNEKGLSEQQKLIITVISVVAVLVANVSFLGYVTPPGGPHPYWETCNNHVYVAFMVLNGLAFLFSLGATGVVVVLPWLYPEKDAGIHKVSINRWISWGLSLLFSSILFFTVAFAAAGLVTGGFKAPELQCGVLPCEYGGMPCVPSTQADTDVFKMLLPLNNMSGDCFAVWGVARGSDIPDGLVDGSKDISPVQYNNNGFFNLDSDFNANFTRDACYLKIRDINSTNPDQHLNHTKNVLCTAGLVPNGYDYWGHPKHGVDPQAAGRVGYQDALVNMTTAGSLWWSGRTAPQNGSLNTWYYMILGTSVPGTWCPSNANSGCACSDSMIQEWDDGNLMFVTYAPPGRPRGVYAASLVNESHPHFVEFPKTARGRFYNLQPAQVSSQFQQEMNLYAPPLFLRENVAVYDESHIRCIQSAKVPKPTLCMFKQDARDDSPKWYSPVDGSSSVFQRQCGPRNSTENVKCTGLAVDTQGALIMTSKLGDFGYEVVYDKNYIESLGQQTGIFAFVILAIALGLYACVFVAVWCCRRRCKPCA